MLREFDYERRKTQAAHEESIRHLNVTIKDLKDNRERLEN
jgi:hypothetical protein